MDGTILIIVNCILNTQLELSMSWSRKNFNEAWNYHDDIKRVRSKSSEGGSCCERMEHSTVTHKRQVQAITVMSQYSMFCCRISIQACVTRVVVTTYLQVGVWNFTTRQRQQSLQGSTGPGSPNIHMLRIITGDYHGISTAFQGVFQARQECWEQCVTGQGEYFEGEGSKI